MPNILGGMCARVCPTETLCEEVCVREVAEGKPVEIGRLQRYATDTLFAARPPALPPGRRRPAARWPWSAPVLPASPARTSSATLGHAVTVLEARDKPGGLNEYGIAAYKTVDGFAQAEVDYILGVGGIELRTGVRLGRDVTLAELRRDYDAVFLGLGLGARERAGHRRGGARRRRWTRSPTSRPCARRRIWRRCRSAAASWSSAAA